MDRKLSEYPEKYDWVKVRSNKKHSLGRRNWNGNTNMLIGEDEIVILPRGVKGEDDSELSGMKFYFKNGFYEIVDHEPFGNDLENNNSNSIDEIDYRSRTKDELKNLCEERDLKKTGNKDELISRLEGE